MVKGFRLPVSTQKLATHKAIKGTAAASRSLVNKVVKFSNGNPIAKWGAVGWVLVTQNRLSNVDSALSQIRETFSLILTNTVSTAWTPEEAFERLDELEDQIASYESQAKLVGHTPTSILTGRLLPIQQRIAKLRDVLPGIRAKVAKIEAQQDAGVILDPEEIALLLSEVNDQLEGFGKSSKFLGVI